MAAMTTDDVVDAVDGQDDVRLEEAVEAYEALEAEVEKRGLLRLDYVILAALFLLFAGFTLSYFVLALSLDSLKDYGYIGIFFIAMAGAATIVLPTPSNVAIFSGGVVLHPVLGIPAPLLVGLVAGLGDSIGELSGY